MPSETYDTLALTYKTFWYNRPETLNIDSISLLSIYSLKNSYYVKMRKTTSIFVNNRIIYKRQNAPANVNPRAPYPGIRRGLDILVYNQS